MVPWMVTLGAQLYGDMKRDSPFQSSYIGPFKGLYSPPCTPQHAWLSYQARTTKSGTLSHHMSHMRHTCTLPAHDCDHGTTRVIKSRSPLKYGIYLSLINSQISGKLRRQSHAVQLMSTYLLFSTYVELRVTILVFSHMDRRSLPRIPPVPIQFH